MNLNLSKMYSKFPRRSDESGIALIAVLWALLLLCTLAASGAYVARANAEVTHRALELARAEAAADAAIVLAISELSNERAVHRPATDGSKHSSELEGFRVTVSISEEAGRIDINSADDDLILAFLESQGLKDNVAETMLIALERTPSRDRRIATPEELKQIPGWKPQNVDCWAAALTVYSGLPSVNDRVAAPMVSRALRWAEARHFHSRDWLRAAPNSSLADSRSVIGDVLRIRATATASEVATATRQWVGRLTGDRQRPMLTMRWDTSAISTDCLPEQMD
jgi:general secretion pathway protein K